VKVFSKSFGFDTRLYHFRHKKELDCGYPVKIELSKKIRVLKNVTLPSLKWTKLRYYLSIQDVNKFCAVYFIGKPTGNVATHRFVLPRPYSKHFHARLKIFIAYKYVLCYTLSSCFWCCMLRCRGHFFIVAIRIWMDEGTRFVTWLIRGEILQVLKLTIHCNLENDCLCIFLNVYNLKLSNFKWTS
jgi:hypothetical protein